jgi:alkaline phosphatase
MGFRSWAFSWPWLQHSAGSPNKEQKMLNRKSSVLLALVLLVATLAVFRFVVPPSSASPHVRHVIFFVGDGMQHAAEVATSRYLYGEDNGMPWHDFPYQVPVATWDVTTYNNFAAQADRPPFAMEGFDPSLGYDPSVAGDDPYPIHASEEADRYFVPPGGKAFATDSASSSTAWATGHKVEDGKIAWHAGDEPDGALTTIAQRLRDERGYSIGIVTTVPFNHATPAAQVAHNISRNNYAEIAQQILTEMKPDVVIGGGHPAYSDRYVPRALLEALKADASYVVAERRQGHDGAAALAEAAREAISGGRRLFGLFGGPGGNFEPPRPVHSPGSPEVRRATLENPLLAEATVAALELLSTNKQGFFVQIEQGDIDWANHDNDYARMIGTTWDLDLAVRAAVEFVDRPGDHLTWENTLIVVTADHVTGGLRFNPDVRLGLGMLPVQEGENRSFTYPEGEVTYASRSHTNELVLLYARGAGNGLFARYEGTWYPCTRIVDNTQVFSVLAEATGLSARSPSRPGELRPAACAN